MNKTYQFEMSEEEIRLVMIYRKSCIEDECSNPKEIRSISDAQNFIDGFKSLIDSEKTMQVNSNLVHRYLHRILTLFHERCVFYGQDSYEHIDSLLESIRDGTKAEKEISRPTLN